MRKVLIVIILLLPQFVFSQKIYRKMNAEVTALHTRAQQLYSNQRYKEAAGVYARLLRIDPGHIVSAYQYEAARAWSMAHCTDSAFVILTNIAVHYSDYNSISNDEAFNALHADGRWQKLMDKIRANEHTTTAHIDPHLKAILDTILADDQDERKRSFEIRQQYGMSSIEMQRLNKSIAAKDAVNIEKIRSILNVYGWPEPDAIGEEGEITIFLVIQHAPLEVQKTFSSQLEAAYRKGLIQPDFYALFLDRIAVREGGLQIYGSQVFMDSASTSYYVLPMLDPANVDSRRATINLGPMNEYLERYNMVWSVAEYEKRLKLIHK